MNNELFPDDAYDLPEKQQVIREMITKVERTEYAINFRDGTDNNARQICTHVGGRIETEDFLTTAMQKGVVSYIDSDSSVVLIPVSRVLSVEIFAGDTW